VVEILRWLKDTTGQALEHARAIGDPVAGWTVLEELRLVTERKSQQVFGVQIGLATAGIQHEMGPWLESQRASFGSAVRREFLSLLGHGVPQEAPTSPSLLGRLLRAPTPERPPITVDEAAASRFAARAATALLPLVSHDDPLVRRVVASALAVTDACEVLDSQVRVENDLEVASAILKTLNSMDWVLSESSCRAVWARHAEVRRLVHLKPARSATRMRALVADPMMVEAALRALADPSVNRFGPVRDELIIECLTNASPQVRDAALAGVCVWMPAAAGPTVLELARTGHRLALEALGRLSIDNPSLGIDLILENAARTPPVMSGLDQLLSSPRLSREQRARCHSVLTVIPPVERLPSPESPEVSSTTAWVSARLELAFAAQAQARGWRWEEAAKGLERTATPFINAIHAIRLAYGPDLPLDEVVAELSAQESERRGLSQEMVEALRRMGADALEQKVPQLIACLRSHWSPLAVARNLEAAFGLDSAVTHARAWEIQRASDEHLLVFSDQLLEHGVDWSREGRPSAESAIAEGPN
jgi:hypothetical protein